MSKKTNSNILNIRLSNELELSLQTVIETLKGMEIYYTIPQGGNLSAHVSSRNELIECFIYLGLMNLEKDVSNRLDRATAEYNGWHAILSDLSSINSHDKIPDDLHEHHGGQPIGVTDVHRPQALDRVDDLQDLINRLTAAKIGIWKARHSAGRMSVYSEQDALPKVEDESWHLMASIGRDKQQSTR